LLKGTPAPPRGAREVIAENIRYPGDNHEWLMVAEARQFKKWGISMGTIREGRTFTEATIGRRFRHGVQPGSDIMHRELRAMVRSSNSYDEFLEKLNQWADHELAPSIAHGGPRYTSRALYPSRQSPKCGATRCRPLRVYHGQSSSLDATPMYKRSMGRIAKRWPVRS